MNRIKKVLVSISNPEDYRLFRRLNAGLVDLSLSYVANNLPIYLYLRFHGETVHYPRRRIVESTPPVENGFSVKTGRLSLQTARACYGGYYHFISAMQDLERWDLLIVPSGRLVGQWGLVDAARIKGLPTVFTGYGNVDNRIFADPQGTDRQSLLYSKPSILDAYTPDMEAFEIWRMDYVENRKMKHVVAQAKGINLKTRLLKLIQILFCKAEGLLGLGSENEFGFSEMKKMKITPLKFDALPKEKYVFFPLQVSSDAQVILNYKHGNLLSALREAADFAKSRKLALVIKPHPAELNQAVLDQISGLRASLDFRIVDENTFRLIEGASVVVTINSTVGLEGMLMDKEVHFLGESMYASFNRKRLAAYISCYLINEPYFSASNKPFFAENALKLIERSALA